MKVRQAIREKYGIQKPIREDDDYEIDDEDSIRMNNTRTGITLQNHLNFGLYFSNPSREKFCRKTIIWG